MSLEPAALGTSPKGEAADIPYSPLYDDTYYTAAGAEQQAQQVFLDGNHLPARWQGRTRFVILETGFGLGNNFLTTWMAWRQDPARCPHLVFVSVEKHPLLKADLARVHGLSLDQADNATLPTDAQPRTTDHDTTRHGLASRLLAAWPTLTPGLHSLHFDEPLPDATAAVSPSGQPPHRVSLLLGLGDIQDTLPALVASVDAFYLDGFSPAKNPRMWDADLLSRLNRLAAPCATAATWTVARGVRDALTTAGFRVERLPGLGSKRDMIRAVYEPRYTPPRQAGGWWPEPARVEDRQAIVVGAGLAGCATTLALCRAGWRVTLIDQHAGPAQAASGNPGGLYHSIVHGDDGLHARAHRAAALSTWRLVKDWIADGSLQGSSTGLLRLDSELHADQAQALMSRQHLPADHVQWLEQAAAQQLAGMPVPSGGWLFHQAGWLHPAGLARRMLDEAASWQRDGQAALNCLWQQAPDSISMTPDGRWQACRKAETLATASTLIVCNASDASCLLHTLPSEQAVSVPPLSTTRGQITAVHTRPLDGMRTPNLPVAGNGYVLPLSVQTMLCGATNQLGDTDASVRQADHRHNLAQAAALGVCSPQTAANLDTGGLQGRTSWRAAAQDRLPVIGALAWSPERLTASTPARRLDQVRLLPRQRSERGGLYVVAGLGSRGITWAGLIGDLIAHWVAGTPSPIEADLRDALDPARFVIRQMTRRVKVASQT